MTSILLTSDSVDGYNGTQTYDGWFPRYYSKPQYAKAALTRFLGESVNWSPRTGLS